MKWVLVHIMITAGLGIEAKVEGTFNDMHDCFWARDYLATEKGGEDGFFPNNQQGVCVASTKLNADK